MGKLYKITIGLLLFSGAAIAQQRVVIIDSESIMEKFEDAKLARQTLDQQQLLWRHELDSIVDLYNIAEAEFKVQQPMLSEDALRARQQEMEALREQKETFAQDIWGKGGKAEQKHKELFSPVMERINEVIEQIAQEKEADVVFDISSGVILYAETNLDITETVLEELNREYATIASDIKKKVAVLGVAALDEESQTEGLSTEIRSYVTKTVLGLEKELNLEVMNDAEILQTVELFGESLERPMEKTQAVNIGENLDADFIYMGEVEKEGSDIIVKMWVIKVESRTSMPDKKVVVAEKEKDLLLNQKVSEMVTDLQAYLIEDSE